MIAPMAFDPNIQTGAEAYQNALLSMSEYYTRLANLQAQNLANQTVAAKLPYVGGTAAAEMAEAQAMAPYIQAQTREQDIKNALESAKIPYRDQLAQAALKAAQEAPALTAANVEDIESQAEQRKLQLNVTRAMLGLDSTPSAVTPSSGAGTGMLSQQSTGVAFPSAAPTTSSIGMPSLSFGMRASQAPLASLFGQKQSTSLGTNPLYIYSRLYSAMPPEVKQTFQAQHPEQTLSILEGAAQAAQSYAAPQTDTGVSLGEVMRHSQLAPMPLSDHARAILGIPSQSVTNSAVPDGLIADSSKAQANADPVQNPSIALDTMPDRGASALVRTDAPNSPGGLTTAVTPQAQAAESMATTSHQNTPTISDADAAESLRQQSIMKVVHNTTDQTTYKRANASLALDTNLLVNRAYYSSMIRGAIRFNGIAGKASQAWATAAATMGQKPPSGNIQDAVDYYNYTHQFTPLITNQVKFMEGMASTDEQRKEITRLLNPIRLMGGNPDVAEKEINNAIDELHMLSQSLYSTAESGGGAITNGIYQARLNYSLKSAGRSDFKLSPGEKYTNIYLIAKPGGNDMHIVRDKGLFNEAMRRGYVDISRFQAPLANTSYLPSSNAMMTPAGQSEEAQAQEDKNADSAGIEEEEQGDGNE